MPTARNTHEKRHRFADLISSRISEFGRFQYALLCRSVLELSDGRKLCVSDSKANCWCRTRTSYSEMKLTPRLNMSKSFTLKQPSMKSESTSHTLPDWLFVQYVRDCSVPEYSYSRIWMPCECAACYGNSLRLNGYLAELRRSYPRRRNTVSYWTTAEVELQ